MYLEVLSKFTCIAIENTYQSSVMRGNIYKSTKNDYLRSALIEYKNVQSPGYAVLIDAPWGAGKTFFIKSCFPPSKKNLTDRDSKKSNHSPVLYMSINGCPDATEFRNRLFAARFPEVKYSKFGKLSSVALSWLQGNQNIDPTLFAVEPGAFYIIDDLERCTMKIEEALGAINDLVEMHDCHVVILANRTELTEPSAWTKIEEKVVGQTFELIPDLNIPYDHFVSKLNSIKCRELLLSDISRRKILVAFDNVCEGNLRILSRSLYLLDKIFEILSDDLLAVGENKLVIFSIYLMSMYNAVHTGILDREMLAKLRSEEIGHPNIQRLTDERVRSYIKKLELYGLDRGLVFFSNRTFHQVFVEGYIDEVSVNNELMKCALFVPVQSRESWQTVWYGAEVDDSDFASAKKDMLAKWINREYLAPGVILHVFMLKCWLGTLGEIDITLEELYTDLDIYLTEVAANGAFREEMPREAFKSEIFQTHGLETIGENHFECLGESSYKILQVAKSKIGESRALSLEAQYSDWAEKLIDLLFESPSEFEAVACSSGSGTEGVFRSIPIFDAKHADLLFETLINHPNIIQKNSINSLSRRYQFEVLKNALKSEKSFIRALREKISTHSLGLTGIQKHRFIKYLEKLPSEHEE